MTPDQVVDRMSALLPAAPAAASYGVGSQDVAVDVDRGGWVAAATAVRDDRQLAGTYFDLLTGVDQEPDGLEVVVRLWSPTGRHGVVLRTRCPVEDPHVPTLTGVFGGAVWHEREVAEMLGVVFDGHPDPRPLLLPDGFEGTPLRKSFALASRADKPWPGLVDPDGKGGRLAPPGSPR